MKKLTNLTDDFLLMDVEIHEAFERIRPYRINVNLLAQGYTKDKVTSLEALSTTSLHPDTIVKETVAYASSLQQSVNRYLDVIEKQCKLASDSINPLLEANLVFKTIYGEERYKNLKNTKVNYFSKDPKRDYPLAILEQVAESILTHGEDDIKYTCVKLLKCPYKEAQLDYPKINSLLNSKTTSLEALGHTVDAFNLELTYLSGADSDKGIPSYRQLVQKKKDVLSKINKKYSEVVDYVQNLKSKLSSKDELETLSKNISDLQCYSVALSSIMFLLQSTSYTAYEAGYTLHLAELSYNI
jgi:hypothetical protein